MILGLTTEYLWGPIETEKMINEGLVCNGFKIMKDIENDFALGNYELTCWMPQQGIDGIKKYLSQNPTTKIISVHAYAPLKENFSLGNHPADAYNLSSCNPEKRKLALEGLKKTINLASKLNAENIVIHAGFKERNKGRKENLVSMINSIETASDYINKKGYNIKLGIENGLYPNQIFVNPEEINQIKEFYPKVGLWFDIGHANVNSSSDVYDIAQRCDEIIIGCHIHNNNGKKDLHASLQYGNINLKKALTPLQNKIETEQIPLILELYHFRTFSSKEDVLKSINILKNTFK
ncbi:MAG: sugar phosphate isomerase/epimerase [archaeon]|nr:sugar phosphate isomerase/epimerase [archaeon]